MKLFTMWVKDAYAGIECLDAWDEDTVEANSDGYDARVAEYKAKAAAHGDEFRVIVLDIDDNDIDAAFDVPTARARVI